MVVKLKALVQKETYWEYSPNYLLESNSAAFWKEKGKWSKSKEEERSHVARFSAAMSANIWYFEISKRTVKS